MEDTSYRAIAIVGAGAVLPDAPNVPAFWQNIKSGRYSVSESRPTAGIPRSITMPILAHQIKPTQRSAAGYASMYGSR